MSINTAGALSGIGLEVEANTRAARATMRPIDVGAQGSFSLTYISGTMAAGLTAGAPIYSFRWAPTTTTQLALIKRLTFQAQGLATGFTAGTVEFDFFVARAFTAADSGGNTVSLATNQAKLRTSFGSSSAAIQGASTATLTAGTRTLDTKPIRTVLASISGTGAFTAIVNFTEVLRKQEGEWPLVLANQEGLVIQATVPATGTWNWACSADWDEVSSYAAAAALT